MADGSKQTGFSSTAFQRVASVVAGASLTLIYYGFVLVGQAGRHGTGVIALLAIVSAVIGFFGPKPLYMLVTSAATVILLGIFGESIIPIAPCPPNASCAGYLPGLVIVFGLFWTTLMAGLGASLRKMRRGRL